MADIFGVNNPGFDLNPFTEEEMIILEGIVSLGDPGADVLLGWDDTDNGYRYFTLGSGLSYDHATHTLSVIASGSGDVTGPESSTDNAIVRFNGTDGKTIQNSAVVIDDSDNITGVTSLTIDGASGNVLVVDTDVLVVDASNNRVGIGTASPSFALHLDTSSTDYDGIFVNGNAAPVIAFAPNTATTPTWKAGISGVSGANFSISTGAGATDRLTITNTGNVGINDGTPTQRLAVGGDGSYTGYLVIGTETAPSNTTAGDLTATRFSIGGASLSGNLSTIGMMTGTITATSSTAIGVNINPSISPASNSSAGYRALSMTNSISAGSSNLTAGAGSSAAGFFSNSVFSSGTIAAIAGIASTGIGLGASSTSMGTVSDTAGAYFRGVISSGNSLTTTITQAGGIRIFDSINAGTGPLTMTGQYGVMIDVLDEATNNSSIVIGQSTVPTGNYAIYSATTRDSYYAGKLGIANTSPSALLTLGTAGTTAGTLSLAGGTSGVVTLQTAAAAGTYTLTLPTSDGDASQALTTDGSGVLSWASYQPLDSDLTSWASVTRASGFDTFVATPSSANFASLITDETGTGSVVFSNSPTLVTPVLGDASATSLTLTTALDETDGGTGTDTYTTGDILYASASNTLSKRAIGTSGQVLTVTGGVPTWVSPTSAVGTAFGDASDGTVNMDGTNTFAAFASKSGSTYTLTRNIYADTLTIGSGVTLKTDGWIIYARTITGSGTVTWGTVNNASGQTGGAATTVSGPYKNFAGTNGGNAGGTDPAPAGGSSSSQVAVIGSAGAQGGQGGSNNGGLGGPGGTVGTATAPVTKFGLTAFNTAHMLDFNASFAFVRYTQGTGSTGGGGANSTGGTGGSAGGGAGASGGMVVIFAGTMSGTFTITVNGGNGANSASQSGGASGGGGAGGNGGVVVLVTADKTGYSGTINRNGGTGGTAGSAVIQGAAGANGATGTLYDINITQLI